MGRWYFQVSEFEKSTLRHAIAACTSSLHATRTRASHQKLSSIKHGSHQKHPPSLIPQYRPIIDFGEKMAQTYDAGPVSRGSFDDAVSRLSAHCVCGVLLFIYYRGSYPRIKTLAFPFTSIPHLDLCCETPDFEPHEVIALPPPFRPLTLLLPCVLRCYSQSLPSS